MNRLEEIRQQCSEAWADCAKGYMIHTEDVDYLLSEVDRLNNGLMWALDTANANAKLFDEATARAEAAEARADAAVEDLKLALIDEALDPRHCCEYGCTDHCTHPDGPTCGETGGKNWKWRGTQAGKGAK